MAIVIVNTMERGSEDLYKQVSSKVMSGNQLPEGCQVHIAGPSDGGWRVITVWDSEEQFNKFRNDKLIPAIRETAGDEAIAPSIKAEPAHTVITA
jgi:hypothetical protein